MTPTLKIAVYSGEIPSTTFIERLIEGLSKTNKTIYLFGALVKKVSYKDSVIVVGYTHNRFRKFLHLLKYTLLLTFFKFKDKKKLDQILKNQSNNLIYSKVKSYPILWHHPDVFHLQWAKGIEEWSWVQEFGIKLVVSLRGAHINYSPIANLELASMYRTYFARVDSFHAVSKNMSVEASKYGAHLDKTKVIYSGLNLEDFKHSPKKQNDVFNIISVGRPHWIKGYVYALDACKILKEAGLKFHYTIIGGSNDIELEYQIHDLDLQHHVTLDIQKPFENVKNSIMSADLLLLPSTKEGIANVVLEAMALETLVLSTDCGGINEVIVNGINGFIVPIRDPKSIAECIFTIYSLSEESKTNIKLSALNTLKNQHTEEQMVSGMLELYELL